MDLATNNFNVSMEFALGVLDKHVGLGLIFYLTSLMKVFTLEKKKVFIVKHDLKINISTKKS